MLNKIQIGGLVFLSLLILAFALDASIMSAIQDADGVLKSIGRVLSWFGNSAWMFNTLLILAFIAAILAQSASSQETRRNAQLLLKFAVILFAAILISGVCVQILKHFFGRARPILFEEAGAFEFTPFAFDMKRNSFPSGHATSIGALTMIGAIFLPRYRIAFGAIALIVGLARIADGAHYLSDILAGLTLGGGTSYALVRALTAYGVIPAPTSAAWQAVGSMIKRWYRAAVGGSLREAGQQVDVVLLRLTVAVFAAFTVMLVIFVSMPQIDIAISALFFYPDAGFAYDHAPVLNVLRKTYWLSILVAFFGALVLCCAALRLPENTQIHWSIWGFMASAFLIGPGLVANSLFKTYWGRARPANIEEFGGSAQFTLPFEFASECARNCSFVSGEGSGIAMLFLVIVALGWPVFRKAPAQWLSPMAAIAIFGMAMRIMKGRHFLSDTLFAGLLMALVILVLYRVFEVGWHREGLTRRAFKHDIRALFAYLTASLATSRSLLRDLLRVSAALGRVGRTTLDIATALRQAATQALRSSRERSSA